MKETHRQLAALLRRESQDPRNSITRLVDINNAVATEFYRLSGIQLQLTDYDDIDDDVTREVLLYNAEYIARNRGRVKRKY